MSDVHSHQVYTLDGVLHETSSTVVLLGLSAFSGPERYRLRHGIKSAATLMLV
ncbi:unnamed protein product [Trichobilharzia regenti]|nr:unnamed protein product [Trichobilharzia regenti]